MEQLRNRVQAATVNGLAVSDKEHLHDLFEEVFSLKLCRTCETDRVFAYLKLKKWLNETQPAPVFPLKTKVLKPKIKKK